MGMPSPRRAFIAIRRTVTLRRSLITQILAVHGLFLTALAVAAETRAGAAWWSLQPLASVVPPNVRKADWGANPIDAFLATKLESNGLTPSPPADPRAQIRRVYFDLIGMPPSAEAVRAFEEDAGEAAYGRIVDGLLASPAYGERWARHGLDVARFGESDGFERNFPRENLWPFRD